jgi:hypothetical protein
VQEGAARARDDVRAALGLRPGDPRRADEQVGRPVAVDVARAREREAEESVRDRPGDLAQDAEGRAGVDPGVPALERRAGAVLAADRDVGDPVEVDVPDPGRGGAEALAEEAPRDRVQQRAVGARADADGATICPPTTCWRTPITKSERPSPSRSPTPSRPTPKAVYSGSPSTSYSTVPVAPETTRT